MTAPDPRTLAVLAAAGFPLAALTPEQLEVLTALAEDELALLLDIKAKLDEVEPEVQAHGTVAGGALF
ncbi:aroma-sacti cluster domain-containing protein [Kitasatospora sp. NPDC002227]|uniref:aroma-sacti cluster domain-containing protein n=1 Tax=Kitasatospora sp. NPDC002227 TaxID=3154773 RepID=UPI0033337AC7